MVLIGSSDVDISQRHKTSSLTNKIGGIPDWPDKDEVASPKCMLCGQNQSLVVQLYCPLECSLYHRTLYVFACPNPPCWNKIESWTVYRCQKLDNSSNQSSQQSNSSSANNAVDRSSDWGTNANDWGDDANDWGDDANDWSDSSDKLSDCIEDLKDSSVSSEIGPSETGPASQYEESSKNRVSETTDSGADDCSSGIEQMSISERTESASSEPDDSLVIQEHMPSVSDDEKSRILKSFNTTEADVGKCRILKAYYINVFEEPVQLLENNRHVTKLLKDYQKREGFNPEDFMEDDRSQAGEKYESTVLIHKDVMFHKFMKRISLCPEQCIRYEWNGFPLFNQVPSVDVPSRCSHCNGETVFELQLTPALVNHLKFAVQVKEGHSEGCVVEFGTVIIYTCGQSCWNDGDKFRTENKMVLPDPDQHLFK